MLTTLALLTTLSAQPTPEATKAVFDHYYTGQGKSLVIAEAFLCAEVAEKSKDNKYDCTKRVEGNLTKGASVNVYLVMLVPEGDKKELMIQSTLDGVVRETKDVTVEGKGMRTRVWKTFTASKAGKWEFKVLDGSTALSTITATAE
jgi:hypothetical protein